MKKVIFIIAIFILAGCATGENGNKQVNFQTGVANEKGQIKNISGQADLFTNADTIGNLTINYETGKADLEDLKKELIKRDEHISELQAEINSLKKEFRPTKLMVDSNSVKQLDNGKYEYIINLKPIGNNVIPLFKIFCKVDPGTIIESVNAKGNTIPPIYMGSSNDSKTYVGNTYNNVAPSEIEVRIITNRKPESIAFYINPLKT